MLVQGVQWLASAFTHKLILILRPTHGRTDCELEILYYNLYSQNLMNCTCYVVTSPSILCALWKPDLMTVLDNELT